MKPDARSALPATDTEDSEDGARQGIQSIEVGVPLLRALTEHGGPMMLRDLARAAGMPAAKAHRYLVSFIRVGLVTQEPQSGYYDLGSFSLTLGLASLQRLDALRIATPVLHELNEKTGETVALSVWGNMGPTFVRWIESRRPLSVNLRTGDVMPLLHSSTGLCFAVFLDTSTVRNRIGEDLALAKKGNDPRPPRSAAEFETIATESRQQGMTRGMGVMAPNIHSFSAPVFNHDNTMVLAITALGPAGLFDGDWKGEIAHAVRNAARSISLGLGCNAVPPRG